MNPQEIKFVAEAGRSKLEMLNKYPWRYLVRAAIAGAYVMIGTLLSVVSAAWFYQSHMGIAKLLGAFTFSVALILVVLIGGELFTGTNFILSIAILEKKVRLVEAVRLWIVCYVGNFAGVFVLAVLIVGSGSSAALMAEYLASAVPGRLACSVLQLVFRGVMCNFLVCTGVFAGMKLKSETGKCIVITAAITTFVFSGFEHSIANMATFSLYVLLVPGADLLGCVWNMIWVTVGNLLGGAVLLALPIWFGVPSLK